MRDAFPALARRPGWTYLDSAATGLLHEDVLHAVHDALARGGSAGRGSHRAGAEASQCLASAREKIAGHLGVNSREIVFVKSATEGLNLVAHGWAMPNLLPGDEILVSALEHHSNLLPWRAVAREAGARVRTVPCDARGDLDLERLSTLLDHAPRILAVSHVSNVTGARVPVRAVVERVRGRAPECLVVVDGTQAVPHMSVDLGLIGADFYVFSGHKAYGPLGAGVVWARPDRWRQTRPLLWGGGMVSGVTHATEVLSEVPWCFEGGTPNHPAITGLAAGLDLCSEQPSNLANLAADALDQIPGVRVLGDPEQRVGIVSWVHDTLHPHDVATLLESRGLAVRAGHMCARPYLAHLGVEAAVRASFGVFNDEDDVRKLIEAVRWVQRRSEGAA